MVGALLKSDLPAEQKSMVAEMGKELSDLVLVRRMYVREFTNYESIRLKILHKLQSLSFRIS